MTEEFRKKLEATFHEEASEHLHHLGSGLIDWEKEGGEAASERGESLFRSVHSLKGAARAVGYLEMETLCQALEGVFSALRKHRVPLSEGMFDAFNRARAQLERMLAARRRGQPPLAPDADLVAHLHALESGRETVEAAPAAAGNRAGAEARDADSRPSEEADAPEPGTAAATIRLPMGKIEELNEGINGLIGVRTSAGRLMALLEEVQQTAAEAAALLRGRADAGPAAGGEYTRLARELEAAARTAARQGILHRDRLEQSAGSLAAGIREVMMVPLEDLLSIFPRIARDLAMETGKRIRVTLDGADREVEKPLLEDLREILLHLVRNAVDHGIEPPVEREAAGKPPQGLLAIQASLAPGGGIAIEVEDDGRGIDTAALRESAARSGSLAPEAMAGLEGKDLLNLVFRSGVTTRAAASTLSGRGLGMAIVRERVEAMGGTITVSSHPGKGTRFRMVLPSRRSTARGVVVVAGDGTYVIPTPLIKRVSRYRFPDPSPGSPPPTVQTGEEWLEVVPLYALLGGNPRAHASGRRGGEAGAVLLVRADGASSAVYVDAVLGEQEIAVQRLGRRLRGLPHLSGATQLRSGGHALVLAPAAFRASGVAGQSPAQKRSADSPGRAANAVDAPRRVLVVEDSITTRTLIKSLLETAGYAVSTAVDGLAAWQFLEEAGPAVIDAIVSDVEMPRMGGFELLSNVRASDTWRHVPVILVTSLSSPGERARGLALGANAYMTKGEFDAGVLLESLEGRR
jgi:two-component system chemotaxis sensor kinase CheA